MDFRFYFSLFRRRFHWFVLVAVLVSVAGFALSRLLPTVFVARALLVVESEQIPDAMAASTVEVQATEQLQIIQQRILTRDTLVEMANRLQIYGSDIRGNGAPLDADAIVEDLRERIIIVTTGGTQPRGPVQATLVNVSFDAPTASLAANVANEVVTLILREDVEMRTGAARDTLAFFKQEVERLDTELSERGAAILTFKEANQSALPDSIEFRRGQQAAAQERLLELQRAEDETRDRRERLVRVHEATGGTADTTPLQQQTLEERQLNELRTQLAALLVVLAPENPRVKLLENQISALETVVAQQGAAGGVDEEGRELTAFEVQLADVDGQLAYLEQQRSQILAELQALQLTIDATPGNAIALDALQRDYDNARVQYDQAVANQARAETGDTIEALSKGQRISVIEQAVAPREPDRPNRPLIAGAGVGGGIGLGLALVALLEFFNRGIRRPQDLTAALGITPFATLPYLETKSERQWQRLRTVVVFLITVALVAAVAWAVNRYYMPLDLLFDRLIDRVSAVMASSSNKA